MLTSVVALALASGLIVVIQSLNVSSHRAINMYMENLGANMVVIPARLDLFAYYSADPVALEAAHLPESHFYRLSDSKIKGITGIDPRLSIPIKIGGARVLLTGILPGKVLRPKTKETTEKDPFAVLSLLDPESGSVVLGSEVKTVLLKKKPEHWIGLFGKKLRIRGVLPRQGTSDDMRVYLHLRFLQKQLARPFDLSEIRVLYTGNEGPEKIASLIEGTLGDTRVVTQHRTARKQAEIMDSVSKYAFLLLAVILALAWITIGNEMFLNAHERKREIGVLMALGATTRTIQMIFFLKAVFLALVGGLLGYGIGTAVSFLIAPRFLHMKVHLNGSLIPLAIGMAVVLSMLCSAAPAWRASRMDPAQILHEN